MYYEYSKNEYKTNHDVLINPIWYNDTVQKISRDFKSISRRSVVPVMGMEGKYIASGQFSGKCIGVLTSGGDAQGMNSALRAIVRMGIYCGCKVFFIKEGYQGLVDGGESVVEANWATVSGIIEQGGTIIGSARCKEFRERTGRLKAAEHLIKYGITNLVVIGGDGSLTGANIFRVEWPELLNELVLQGKIADDVRDAHIHLNIVGVVGSIDNDFCGSDMTIGADSALRRVIETIDDISTTAHSHKRCFILEVMGRNCGYLALVSAMAGEADWVFIPELPLSSGWRDRFCAKIEKNREFGERATIIVVAEGALDEELKPITCRQIEKLIVDKLNLDTRITVLGHVQRGGRPSAFDRLLGIRMGAEAVLTLLHTNKDHKDPASVICIDGNQIVRMPLMKCVEKTRAVTTALQNKNFDEAIRLRGKSFMHNINIYIKLSKLVPPSLPRKSTIMALNKKIRLAMVNVGAPACGINAAMRSFTRLAITLGYEVVGIMKGFRGLINDSVQVINWSDVRGWSALGGSTLGIRRDTPQEVGINMVAEKLGEHGISGLLLIGGFQALECMLQLEECRRIYPEFCIPIIMLPATISNNLPGSQFCLGADTAINEITTAIDKLKQSALGCRRRLFVMETMGNRCGYLATMGALAGGADEAYIFEEPFNIDDLRHDITHMQAKFADNVERGLIMISEKASSNYNCDFIKRLYTQEAGNLFDCRYNVLGHIQQGGSPSPFDRNFGTKLGALAIEWLDTQVNKHSFNGKVMTNTTDSSCMLGIIRREYKFTSAEDLRKLADFKLRLPRKTWWLHLRPVMRIMSKHWSLYDSDSIMIGAE